MKKLSIAVLIALLLVSVFPAMAFAEESPINPGYEVKFMLDVSQFATADDIADAFQASHDEDLKVYYFDTPDQIFRKLNYVHRLRIYDGDKKTNITYKRLSRIRLQQMPLQKLPNMASMETCQITNTRSIRSQAMIVSPSAGKKSLTRMIN